MDTIVRIDLDNEMDLIIAHKRTMKLAELCGLSISLQTTFATAVSEIARCAINMGENSYLKLTIDSPGGNRKEIVATIYDDIDLIAQNSESVSYARKLMGNIDSLKAGEKYEIKIRLAIMLSGLLSLQKIKSFKDYFKDEPAISPYDEIRKKNILLIELTEKLKESESQYRLLSDNLPLMMFAANQRGEITFYNKWLSSFFSTAGNTIADSTWQSWVHPDDFRQIRQGWDKYRATQSTFSMQARLKQKNNGDYIWHYISIIPVKTEHNQLINWTGFFVDIHAQKLVEETLKDNKALKHAQEQLKNYQLSLEEKINELNLSNNRLEQFAYIASHDLQEPLRKLTTFSSRITMSNELTGQNKLYLGKMNECALQMSTLITDVLNYSMLSDPKKYFELTPLDSIISDVKLNFEQLVEEKNAVIHSEQLPVIDCVPAQIMQLFSNLLSNSLKFTKREPVIHISSAPLASDEINGDKLDASKSYVKITFSDNGVGFDPQYKRQIFDIFKRLNSKQDFKGTGIGLALCKKIMENHGGYIEADSELDKGTKFNMYFPV